MRNSKRGFIKKLIKFTGILFKKNFKLALFEETLAIFH